MDKNKKILYNGIVRWDENLDVLFKVEAEYKKRIIEKYKHKLEQTKGAFKAYGYTHGYSIVEKNNFIEIVYSSNLEVLRIKFDEPTAEDYYIFDFSIKKQNNRLEYFVYIVPEQNNLSIPKWSVSIQHPIPSNIEEAKRGMKEIAEEIIMVQEKIKDLDKLELKYAFHNEQKQNREIKELKRFDSFLSIMQYLIENPNYLNNK